jgi:hypothetical protein
MEVQSRAYLPENLWLKKCLGMEWGSGRSKLQYKNTGANVNPRVCQPTKLDIFRKKWLSNEKDKVQGKEKHEFG